MCLDSWQEKFEPNDDMIVGYKAFKLSIKNFCVDRYQKTRRQIGIVHQAEPIKIYTNQWMVRLPQEYWTGFHIYHTLQAVVSIHPVFEVHGWDIRYKGRQDGCICWITNYMRIIRRVK